MGVLIAILTLLFLFYRRHRNKRIAAEEKDNIPELPPLLSSNRVNSKLFPAELDPEGEAVKGPVELDHKPALPSRGPAELAVSPSELPAEPTESEYHDDRGPTHPYSRTPSLKKDKHITPNITAASVSPANSARQQVPPPPPPSLATVPSIANTTPRSSPLRPRYPVLGKTMDHEHPNQSNWSLEEQQTKALSTPGKDEEGDTKRPRTIAEKRKVELPPLRADGVFTSSSGPWHDAYDANARGA